MNWRQFWGDIISLIYSIWYTVYHIIWFIYCAYQYTVYIKYCISLNWISRHFKTFIFKPKSSFLRKMLDWELEWIGWISRNPEIHPRYTDYGAFNPISQKQFERGDFHVTWCAFVLRISHFRTNKKRPFPLRSVDWSEFVKSVKRMHIRSHGNRLFRIVFVKSGWRPVFGSYCISYTA